MIDVSGRPIALFLVLIVISTIGSAGFAATPPRMRPYTGVGLFIFAQPDKVPAQDLRLQLYEEPGLLRVGMLNDSKRSGNEWVFGSLEGLPPLIVSARKGDWLRVVYDDAGREAWINPENKGRFQSWEQLLKRQTGYILPGLPSLYYKLQQQPGGKLLATLSPKQLFKVLTLEDDWGMVLTDQALIGWLRWRDDDGRLLVGTNP
ncbi:MAG: hypothetical protein HGB32_00705 [Geobacteraceae bacterium]|nr:hypothetical protein [Geobacteraceae bacterium]NTW78652.1 hypothetical protein [Geobacteraceae bacterium]